jgi:hypothetical protein
MNYVCTSTGLYYVRADLYSSNPTGFSFVLKVNGVTVDVQYDTVLAYTTARTVQQFTTQNACKIQITYTGRVCPLYLYAPGVNVVNGAATAQDLTSNNPKVIVANLPVSGNWNLVVHHGVTGGLTVPEPFNVDFKTFT